MNSLGEKNLKTSIIISLVLYIACFFLMQDNSFHFSIGYIISQTHDLSLKEHILVLALIPIYIAIIVFGSAFLSLYLGSVIQNMIKKISNGRLFPRKN